MRIISAPDRNWVNGIRIDQTVQYDKGMTVMQWNAVKTNWPAFVESVMQRWPNSEENDLLTLEGDRDRVAAYLAERHDLTAAEADEQLTAWLQGAVPADVAMDETRDSENIRASAAHIGVGEDVYSDDKDFGDEQVPSRPIGRES